MKKIITVSVLFILLALAFSVRADTNDRSLSGYAWADNVGWLKFDSNPIQPVIMNGATGALSGYAWGDNIGWVSFNSADVVGCSIAPCAPTVNLTTGKVTGWAKALTGAGRTDGWDGWIELAGGNHTSPNTAGTGGVTLDIPNNKFKGFAWGGEVIGWLDFSPNITSTSCGATCAVTVGPGNPLSYSCDGTSPTAGDGTSIGSNASSSDSASWTYVSSGSVGACQWTCANGYEKSGNACVAIGGTPEEPPVTGGGVNCVAPQNATACGSSNQAPDTATPNVLRENQSQCVSTPANKISCEYYCGTTIDASGNLIQLRRIGNAKCALPSGTLEH